MNINGLFCFNKIIYKYNKNGIEKNKCMRLVKNKNNIIK